MVKPGPATVAGVAAVVVLVGVLAWQYRSGSLSTPAALASRPEASRSPGEVLPRIDLDRLQAERPPKPTGERDVFEYGPPPTPPPTPVPPPTLATPPPPVTLAVAPTPPPAPPLNLKYIGTVERKGPQGAFKVAVLLTDKKEVLTGQEGELIANRYRIVKIGLESVDLQDLGSERVQRIPLRGN